MCMVHHYEAYSHPGLHSAVFSVVCIRVTMQSEDLSVFYELQFLAAAV